MSKVENTKIKKVTLWASVVVVLFSLLLSPLAIATTTTVKVDNVKSQIEAAAKVHLIAQKFQNCIGYGGSGNGSITATSISADSAKSGKFYSGSTNILAGSYLEDLINGDDGDKNGEIWCKNDRNTNITKLFADAIGVSVSNIVCNKNDPYYGGLFAPATANYSYGGGVSYELGENKNCSNATNYKYNTHDATTLASGKTITSGKTYIKELYDEYKAKSGNPYLLDFDSLGTYDKIDGYYLYLNDFRTACSNKVFKEEYEGQLAHDDLYFTIFTVNDKGEIGTIYYDHNGKNNNSSSRSSFVSGGPTTCGALVNKINEYSTIYQDEIKKEIKNQCKSALSSVVDEKIAEVQEIIDNEESSEDAKKTAQEKLDEYNKIKNSGQYTTDTEDGGLVCADVPDVKIEVDTPEPDPLDPSNPAATEGDPCYNAGVDGMSWILCPAIENGKNTIDGIDKLLAGWLAIDTETYDENAETRGVWEKFRDIANIAMIIILLVVVFSQLTGYGIDNYGIKKLLPRLIAMAILINLSYIICELLIDLSNVLGVGLSNLFKSMTTYNYSAGEFATDLIAGIFAAIGIAGAVAPIAITIIDASIGGFGPMIIIVLVLTILIALVAILEFFMMLGARLIIIYVFTAIAPVAFACYILPNTQKYFKKWWDIFKAALVVYPICGALYGVSFLIRGIVFRTSGIHLWQALVAVCAPFIPFLILPSLLKKALAGLGAVGDSFLKVTGGLRKGLQKGQSAVKDSAMYKSEQIGRMRNIARYRAGLDKNGNVIDESKIGKFRRFYSGGKTGMAQARAQYLKDQEAIDRENNIMGTGFASAMAGVKNKADAQRVADFQSLIQNGQETVNGQKVNMNDAKSVGNYHSHWLEQYSKAKTDSERAEAMAKIKAAQNILSKTDAGRAVVQSNMANAIRAANSGINSANTAERREAQARMQGLSDAASHLMNNYGDSYKTKNRGLHAMISDLSTMKLGESDIANATNTIAGNLASGTSSYILRGTDKYTAETLAGADDAAIKGLVDHMADMSAQQLADIQATAYEALHNENINVKPEVAKQLERLSASYTPPAASNTQAKILSHGAYRIRGNTTAPAIHLRELDNGKFVDDGGFEVDITHYEKQ